MGKGGGATCECGQVLFETASRKEGDKLNCPWCQRSYRFLGGEKIELIGTADEIDAADREKKKKKHDSEDKTHKQEKTSKNKDKEKEKKRDEAKADRENERERDKEKEEEKEKEKKKRAREPQDGEQQPRRSGRDTQREERISVRQPLPQVKKKADIPGGTGMMIAFIVAFNALAFVSMSLLMPVGPGKDRYPIWGGDPIPSSAIWPLLAALVLGHVVGFVAWSWYVYQLMKLKQLERQSNVIDKSDERRGQ